jgi:pilus assembly protein TadC
LPPVLGDTVDLLMAATTQYLLRSGSDVQQTFRVAMLQAARETPQKDGGAHVERLAAELGLA